MMIYFILLTTLYSLNAERILFNGMHSSDSHVRSSLPLAVRLSEDNHYVHFLETHTREDTLKYPKNISHTFIKLRKDEIVFEQVLRGMWKELYGAGQFPYLWLTGDAALIEMLNEHSDKFESVFNQTWDLVLADELFSVTSYSLAWQAHKNGKAYIMFSTCVAMHLQKYYAAVGTNLLDRPSMFHPEGWHFDVDRFSIRLYSILQAIWQIVKVDYTISRLANKGLYRLGFKNFTFAEFSEKAAYHFIDDVNQLVWPAPIDNSIVNVGWHCPCESSMPNDYLSFVNHPESKGTILIAFGSNVRWEYVTTPILKAFVDGINRLSDYRVVFSFNGNDEQVSTLGKHVKITKWAPQKELLQHNKTKVFISHGGLKSVKDSICGAVPVVYLALFAEQTHNSELARQAHFAEVLTKKTINADLFEATVRKVAETSSYKISALRIRSLYLDQPVSSLDLGAFYVKRAIRYGTKSPFFKKKGIYLSLITHFYVIEITFLIGVIWLLCR